MGNMQLCDMATVQLYEMAAVLLCYLDVLQLHEIGAVQLYADVSVVPL